MLFDFHPIKTNIYIQIELTDTGCRPLSIFHSFNFKIAHKKKPETKKVSQWIIIYIFCTINFIRIQLFSFNLMVKMREKKRTIYKYHSRSNYYCIQYGLYIHKQCVYLFMLNNGYPTPMRDRIRENLFSAKKQRIKLWGEKK